MSSVPGEIKLSSTDEEELDEYLQQVYRKPPLLERESETFQCFSMSPKVKAYKNVLGAGVSFMLATSTPVALSNLQSSLNGDQGLGLATLAISSFVFLISGLFTSSIIRLLGTKYSLVLSFFLSLVYAVANFYPQWYTLVPGAICLGIAYAPMFASVNVHVTTIAIRYAPNLNEKTDHLIAFFTGIVTMFVKLAYIPGNFAITIILFSERHNAGSEIIIDTSFASVCNNTEVDNLDPTFVYTLMSCFLLMSVAALVIALLFIDHLGTEVISQSYNRALKLCIKDPIMATLNMFTDWKTYMLLPMMTTDAFITSSTAGQLAKIYVSDCIGVHWVGLFSITYGVCSATAAVTTGRLVKYVSQFIMVYSFSAVMLGTILFLLFWEREPSYVIAFVPTAIIGLCEGIWHSVPPSMSVKLYTSCWDISLSTIALVGILFPNKKEPAYSVLRMGLAAGYFLGFIIALFFEISVTLWIEVALVVISLITYSILVFITQTKEQLFPCCYKK